MEFIFAILIGIGFGVAMAYRKKWYLLFLVYWVWCLYANTPPLAMGLITVSLVMFALSYTIAQAMVDEKTRKIEEEKRRIEAEKQAEIERQRLEIEAERKRIETERREKISRLVEATKGWKRIFEKSDSIQSFFSSFDGMIANLEELERIGENPGFNPSDYIRMLKEEVQWHLCDAIVRTKLKVIHDINFKFINSKEFKRKCATDFYSSVKEKIERFSDDSLEFADEAIKETFSVAKSDWPGPLCKKAKAYKDSNLDINKEEYEYEEYEYEEYEDGEYEYEEKEEEKEERTEPRDPVAEEFEKIDSMEGHDFERWCADLLRKIGFSDVTVTQGSGDQGVDVLAVKDGIRYAIQCKCYSTDLGNKPVQEVNTGKSIYHCQIGAVMTNRYFTQGARQAAQATGVLLWDRTKLREMIELAASAL